jgi:hypothetical protein
MTGIFRIFTTKSGFAGNAVLPARIKPQKKTTQALE